MRHLLAVGVVALVGTASIGCRGANARVLSAAAPDPHTAELHVRSQVYRMWKRQADCRVVAEYAGYRGEAGVLMSEGGPQPEEVISVIDLWHPSAEAPSDHVRVTFFFRDRKMHSAQFPPPFDPRALALPPPAQPAAPPPAEGGAWERREDLLRPPAPPANPRRADPAPPPAAGGESRQTDLLRQDPPQQAAPCPVCAEPRGDVTPCPHCGIE